MKASELRIGNAIMISGKTEIVYEIKAYSDAMMYANEIRDSAIEAIRLTEEWLVKLGFEHIPREGFSIGLPLPNKRLYVSLSENKEYRDARIMWHDTILTISKQVDFVHQLQNLYFALTGEELVARV